MIEMGKVGFTWFFGVVEDVMDPLQLGRVRVRAHHFYSPNSDVLPTSELPWAHVVMPSTSASYSGKGWSPTFIRPDSTVFGFFVDGVEAQMPIVLGTYPGITQPNPDFVDVNDISAEGHDVSELARGVNKLATTKYSLQDTEFEPPPDATFGAQYPYNKVFESERGHVLEMDDTPGAERIHIYHNQGSYTELSTGLRVDKTNGTSFDISSVGKIIRTAGDLIVVAEGATTFYSKGSLTLASDGAVNISGKLINMSSQLGTNITAGGLIGISAIGALTMQGGVAASLTSGGVLSLGGSSVAVTGGGSLSMTTPGKMTLSGLTGLYLNPAAG